jgi:hypothetical protein
MTVISDDMTNNQAGDEAVDMAKGEPFFTQCIISRALKFAQFSGAVKRNLALWRSLLTSAI